MYLALKNLLKPKYSLLLCVVGYLLIRLVNLTILPVFNDEAIYMYWGWREIHQSGELFYSLLDAKAPLLMWLFGVSMSIFFDPLWAARFVSILTGLFTLLGLYAIGKKFFSLRVAVLTSLLYIIVPLFVFYDRQALMESAVGAVGVWSCYALLNLYITRKPKFALLLGLLLGVGFLVKASVMIFIITAFVVLIYKLVRDRSEISILDIQNLLIVGIVCILTASPLLSQSLFWQTFSSNSRYALTVSDLSHFPIGIWSQNIIALLTIAFWFSTPIIALASLVGLGLAMRRQSIPQNLVLAWFFLGLIFFITLNRTVNVRYVEPLLPLVTLVVAIMTERIHQKKWLVFTILMLIAFPLYLTSLQLFSPINYFETLNRWTTFSQYGEYITSWTAGYGLPEVYNYLEKASLDGPVIVAVRPDAGNPESAIFAFFADEEKVKPIFADSSSLEAIQQFGCQNKSIPIYFVSRDSQLVGLERHLKEKKRFFKPTHQHSVGIYQFKFDCK